MCNKIAVVIRVFQRRFYAHFHDIHGGNAYTSAFTVLQFFDHIHCIGFLFGDEVFGYITESYLYCRCIFVIDTDQFRNGPPYTGMLQCFHHIFNTRIVSFQRFDQFLVKCNIRTVPFKRGLPVKQILIQLLNILFNFEFFTLNGFNLFIGFIELFHFAGKFFVKRADLLFLCSRTANQLFPALHFFILKPCQLFALVPKTQYLLLAVTEPILLFANILSQIVKFLDGFLKDILNLFIFASFFIEHIPHLNQFGIIFTQLRRQVFLEFLVRLKPDLGIFLFGQQTFFVTLGIGDLFLPDKAF